MSTVFSSDSTLNQELLKGAEAASEDDRIWFEQHPGAKERIRPAYPHEIALSGGASTKVRVVQIQPGVRARTPIFEPQGNY